jgi:DNA-binding NtrC family response regulator
MQAPRPRLLIVDDDRAILTLVGSVALKDGFDVTTAVNGEDALRKLAAHSTNLVLLDLRMPGGALKALPSRSAVRLIARRDTTLPLQAIAREHIIKTLDEVNGNKAVSARLLGISRRAFYRQLERHGLHHPIPGRRRIQGSSEGTLERAS